jgi:Na+-driven multidrug efflux pump
MGINDLRGWFNCFKFIIHTYPCIRDYHTERIWVVGVISSVLAVFMILYSLEMRGAINFFYTRSDRPEIRNRNISSIWLVMISFALLMAVLFDIFGEKASAILFISVPYSPYIRIVIWTAFFTVFSRVPQVLYQVKESPIPFVVLLVTNALLNIGFSVYFIVVMRLGALGYLLSAFISSLLMSIPYLIITLRMIRPSFSWASWTNPCLFNTCS